MGVLRNFVAYSGDPSIAAKVNIGFEPGEQAAGGVWEGMDADKEYARYAYENGYGGAMIWAANPNPHRHQKVPNCALRWQLHSWMLCIQCMHGVRQIGPSVLRVVGGLVPSPAIFWWFDRM